VSRFQLSETQEDVERYSTTNLSERQAEPCSLDVTDMAGSYSSIEALLLMTPVDAACT
jgi:hypothetical protein